MLLLAALLVAVLALLLTLSFCEGAGMFEVLVVVGFEYRVGWEMV